MFGSVFEVFRRTVRMLSGGGGAGLPPNLLRSLGGLADSPSGGETGFPAAAVYGLTGATGSGLGDGGRGELLRPAASGGLIPLLLGAILRNSEDGGAVAAATTARFAMPAAIHAEAVSIGDRVVASDYGGNSMPREMTPASPERSAIPVVIQIQALDSRSILERSSDIAAAVRDAMLHSHSLNELIRE